MDPRFDRAQGPTIGFAFGHVLAMDAIGENGDEAASLSERILALLRIQNSAQKPSFPSMKLESHRLARLLVHAAQAGSYTSTGGRQAFADAVWDNCADEQPHCREFQAATLVAAAVSLGLDSPNLRVEDTLVRAIDIAASLEARGEWSPEPDVVATTRRAMNIVSDTNEYAESPLDRLVKQIGAGNTLSQIVPIAFALASRYQDHRVLTTPLRLGAHTNTILSTACIFIGSVRGAEFLRTYGARMVEESLQFDPKESTKNILSGRIPYPDDLLGSDEPSHPITLSGPSSFEDTDPGQRTRQCYFEPVAPPAPLGALRGKTKPGQVLFLGELLVDQTLRSEDYPRSGSTIWARDLGPSPGGSFRALVAARRMGVEAVSLCPIGRGPITDSISQALEREGIVDAGPRIAEDDNRYRLHVAVEDGRRVDVSTNNPLPENATHTWAQAIAAMSPSDVLYIDGALLAHEPYAPALSEAVRWLPEHARVVFDSSSHEGFVPGLPLDNLIISVRASRLPYNSEFFQYFNAGRRYSSPLYDHEARLEHQASALSLLTGRHVAVRADSGEVCFARPIRDDQRIIRPAVTRIAVPSLTEEQALETSGVHSGTLAAALALGIPAERGILFANCAAALATPTSLSTRDAIEAAADELLARDLA